MRSMMKKYRRLLAILPAAIMVLTSVEGVGMTDVYAAGQPAPEAVENVTLLINGTEAENVRNDIEYNLFAGMELLVEPENDAELYKLGVVSVTSGEEAVEWNAETGILHTGADGTVYEITYGVWKGEEQLQEPTLVKTLTVNGSVEVTFEESLDEDGAYLTSLEMNLSSSGTEPFDAEQKPGCDTTADDDIVRSFDRVTYNINASYASYDTNTYYGSGYICYEVILPYDSQEAVFDTKASEPWMELLDGETERVTTSQMKIDGEMKKVQKLRFKVKLEKVEGNTSAIPGGNEIPVIVWVRAMKNGDTMKPWVRAWMEHNTENGSCEVHERGEALTAKPDEVRVSAALRMNVQLAVMGEGKFDVSPKYYDFTSGNEKALNKTSGNVYGHPVAYGVTLQLYNKEQPYNGLLGCELPEGPISFTLELNAAYSYNYMDGEADKTVSTGILSDYQPLVWSYDANSEDNGANQDGRTADYRCVDVAPLNSGGSPVTMKSCYNGGKWSASGQNGNSVTFTVSDYEINVDAFPKMNYRQDGGQTEYYYDFADAKNGQHICCFSAGEIWITQPYYNKTNGKYVLEEYTAPDGSQTEGTFAIEARAGDLNAASKSEQQPQGYGTENKLAETDWLQTGLSDSNQQYKDDDRVNSTVAIDPPGVITPLIHYAQRNDDYLTGNTDVKGTRDWFENGKDTILTGGKFDIRGGYDMTTKNNPLNDVMGSNSMVKFDASGVELDMTNSSTWHGMLKTSDNKMYCDGREYELCWDDNGTLTQTCRGRLLFGTLPSGENWENDDAMQAALEKNLVWYATPDDIPEGHLCVAVMQELRGDFSQFFESHSVFFPYFSFHMKAKADADKKVYMICEVNRVWTERDREKYEAEHGEGSFENAIPTATDLENHEYPESTWLIKPWYEKTIYENNRYVKGHNGNYNIGDSLYILPYYAKIGKAVIQKETVEGKEQPKANYFVHLGQTVADYKLSPALEIPEQTVAGNEKMTLTITDILPEGLNYRSGSAYRGGSYTQNDKSGSQGTVYGGEPFEPVYGSTEDGRTTLTWVLEDVPVSAKELEPIYYSCDIGTDVKNETQLKNTVTIVTGDDGREPCKELGTLSEVQVTAFNLIQTAFSKRPIQAYRELDEPAGYIINYNNNSATAEDILLLDSMPVNGVNGTKLNGSYTMNSWKIDVSKLGDSGLSDFTLYYTTDSKYQGKPLSEIGEDEVKTWQIMPIAADGTVDWGDVVPTAFAMSGTLAGGKTVEVTLEVALTDSAPDDVLCNMLSKADTSVTATVKTMNRWLDGIVWLDENYDGKRQSGEKRPDGITVTLYDSETGKIAKDQLGKECKTVTGNDSAMGGGYYRFDNLPAGNYYVEFTDNSLQYYDVTTYHVFGQPDGDFSRTNDSDVCRTKDKTGNHDRIQLITMPTASELNTMKRDSYSVRYLDAGYNEGVVLPETGAAGNTPEQWKFVGILLIAAALVLPFSKKKKL